MSEVEARWLLACRQVLRDELTGELTAVGILDEVAAARVPSSLQGFALIAQLVRDHEDGEETVEVAFHRGDQDKPVKVTVAEFEDGATTAYAYVSFRLLRATEYGPLTFSVRWKAETGRWRKGPSHDLFIFEPSDAREVRAALDELPPLG